MSKEKMTKAVLTKDGKVLTKHHDTTFAQIEGKTDWAKLAAIKEEDTDYSEIPELTEAFWEEAKASMSEAKKPVSMPHRLNWLPAALADLARLIHPVWTRWLLTTLTYQAG